MKSNHPCPQLSINTDRWARNEKGEFTDDISELVASMKIEDFQLEGYQHHPKIHFPLSN